MQLKAERLSLQPTATHQTVHTHIHRRQLSLLDYSSRPLPYEQIWRWQKQRVHSACHGGIPRSEAVIMVQHMPVYTLGAGSSLKHLNCDARLLPYPIFRTERGGEVTYHGPGQLVLYPIIDLRHHRQDLHWYMRCLERIVLKAVKEVSGIEGHRVEGMTGVWFGRSKIAAIGIRAKRWVTYHGLALNVAMDLDPFKYIVPCGIHDRGVTTIQNILRERSQVPSAEGLIKEYRCALISAFEDVFNVELVDFADSELMAT